MTEEQAVMEQLSNDGIVYQQQAEIVDDDMERAFNMSIHVLSGKETAAKKFTSSKKQQQNDYGEQASWRNNNQTISETQQQQASTTTTTQQTSNNFANNQQQQQYAAASSSGKHQANHVYKLIVPQPPAPPLAPEILQNEELTNLILSWYYSGYYTGYYMGKTMQAKK